MKPLQELEKDPVKIEVAMRNEEKLHNGAYNTWSNKLVTDVLQTV